MRPWQLGQVRTSTGEGAGQKLGPRAVSVERPGAVTLDGCPGRHRTAWNLANLYLRSFDAELLAEDAPAILGLSEETTCFVSFEYFRCGNRFADYVVHEVAHIFHNCKRRAIGLKEVRRREWLLDIDFGRRETFAYACEAYSRILELSGRVQARRDLLADIPPLAAAMSTPLT